MQSIQHIPWDDLVHNQFTPSPGAWEDQTIYFLLVDRFSDNNESGYRDNAGETVSSGETPLFDPAQDKESATQSAEDAEQWRRAGTTWCGGNLRGILSKLGYLKRLGVTTLWISPILKQAAYADDCYHGYGIQNFLEIDPHFGSSSDLRELVATAHSLGMYVILDVILNHSGDVFAYAPDRYPVELPDGSTEMDARWDGNRYEVQGFRDEQGNPSLPFGPVGLNVSPEAAVLPVELQQPDTFTRKGRITNWDNYPEYEEGDFFAFKDIHLGEGEEDNFVPSPALKTLVAIYKYWIGFADLDGLRLDTVKHMSAGSIGYFTHEIHAFAKELGKLNFYIIGEIVAARADACERLECTTLDAALGIGEIPEKIRGIIQGHYAPADYFDIFVNTRREEAEASEALWWRNRVVTFFDDHDLVGQEEKQRVGARYRNETQSHLAVLRAAFLQLFTLGIPCLYYGTEQGFDGHEPSGTSEDNHAILPDTDDRYIRESMFGGAFGAFRSRDRHFFNEESYLYHQLTRLLELRQQNAALRRGRQYLRELSEDGENFWLPTPGEQPYRGIIAWSRLLDVDAFACAINTDTESERSVLVTVDAKRHPVGSTLRCLYSTDSGQIESPLEVEDTANGSAVRLTVPAGGVVLYR